MLADHGVAHDLVVDLQELDRVVLADRFLASLEHHPEDTGHRDLLTIS
jgi:hypothetical protein